MTREQLFANSLNYIRLTVRTDDLRKIINDVDDVGIAKILHDSRLCTNYGILNGRETQITSINLFLGWPNCGFEVSIAGVPDDCRHSQFIIDLPRSMEHHFDVIDNSGCIVLTYTRDDIPTFLTYPDDGDRMVLNIVNGCVRTPNLSKKDFDMTGWKGLLGKEIRPEAPQDGQMGDEIKIKTDIPFGYEIDRERSTFEEVVLRRIMLPETWEGFCDDYPVRPTERFILPDSTIQSPSEADERRREALSDRNVLPNEEYAEAFLALCQLIQLRDVYNSGYKQGPGMERYVIYNSLTDGITTGFWCDTEVHTILAFPKRELRDKFLENFRDIIEKAKPLL